MTRMRPSACILFDAATVSSLSVALPSVTTTSTIGIPTRWFSYNFSLPNLRAFSVCVPPPCLYRISRILIAISLAVDILQGNGIIIIKSILIQFDSGPRGTHNNKSKCELNHKIKTSTSQIVRHYVPIVQLNMMSIKRLKGSICLFSQVQHSSNCTIFPA